MSQTVSWVLMVTTRVIHRPLYSCSYSTRNATSSTGCHPPTFAPGSRLRSVAASTCRGETTLAVSSRSRWIRCRNSTNRGRPRFARDGSHERLR